MFSKKAANQGISGTERIEKLFLEACDMNNLILARICITHNVNPNCFDEANRSPLHIAAYNNYYKLTELLLEIPGINVNTRTILLSTPLYSACKRNHIKIAELLLANGANVNIPNKNGFTPLHSCVINHRNEMIEVLLHNKANINTANCFGKTPLYAAVIDSPNIPIMKLLIENGADMNYYGPQTMPILLEGSLHCLDDYHLKIMTHFIQCGPYINIVDKQTGKTALHMVAISNYIPLAEILVANGADYTIKDITTQTPLDVAMKHNNKNMIFFLKYLDSLHIEERETFYEYLNSKSEISVV